MNIFRKKNQKSYRSESEYASIRDSQSYMSPYTLVELGKYGVTESSQLSLEVFFYTDTEEKAKRLVEDLIALNYNVEVILPEQPSEPFLVNGWSPKMQMDEITVVQWTRQMCDLGQSHDCEFDGWGTTPEQED